MQICAFLGQAVLGKSFYTKLMILRYRFLGIEQYVVDPEREYEKIAKIYEEAVNNNLSEKELLTKEKEIKNIISGTDTLFLNKKTIYKVKRK